MILYFTGTGNSLNVAKEIGEAIDNQLIHINMLDNFDLSNEKVLGIVFPVYYYDAPIPVRQLLKKLKLSKDTYVFSIATCGGGSGTAMHTIKKYVEKAGGKLSYTDVLIMPDNSCISYGKNPNSQIDRLSKIELQLTNIINDILAKKENLPFTRLKISGKLLNAPGIYHLASAMFKPKIDGSLCVGCGICEKVCPQNNIKLLDKKAVRGKNCSTCIACVNMCPEQAIKIGPKPMKKELQYVNPSVQRSEMYIR